MKDIPFKILWFVVSLILCCWATVTQANTSSVDNIRNLFTGVQYAQAGAISKSQAAKIAQDRHGGKVLKVTRSGEHYRVKLLLDDGKVKTVTISAKPSRG